MTWDLASSLSAFHFIRPWWLFVLPVIGALWWLSRKATAQKRELPKVIAPHLAVALSVGRSKTKLFRPIDGIGILLCLLTLGAAGPTWTRVPNPLVADTAPLVVVLKVSKSMLQPDVPPNRLERAKHKILDLLEERGGAKTAIVAYADTAHQVVPLTEDPEVIKPFLEGLDPSVMPRDGETAQAALPQAEAILATQSDPGTILFLLDRVTDGDGQAFEEFASRSNIPVLFWFIGRDAADRKKVVEMPGVAVVDVAADRSDVSTVSRTIQSVYQAALSQDDRQKWRDQGVVFVWPAAVLLLFWFRKGWTMNWSIALLTVGLCLPASDAKSEGWRDWFLTPDQQGKLAFDAKEYQKAADLFEDPTWKAYSLYRLGKYEDAAELYSWQESSDAAMGEGLSLIKSRSYRQAITAFEKAVERDPDNVAAQKNLELARYILNYVETTREQSDTGEERGIGADDIIFDNEAGRGAESQQQQSSSEMVPETAEQWMRTVETRTGDFLKSRFALEAAETAH